MRPTQLKSRNKCCPWTLGFGWIIRGYKQLLFWIYSVIKGVKNMYQLLSMVVNTEKSQTSQCSPKVINIVMLDSNLLIQYCRVVDLALNQAAKPWKPIFRGTISGFVSENVSGINLQPCIMRYKTTENFKTNGRMSRRVAKHPFLFAVFSIETNRSHLILLRRAECHIDLSSATKFLKSGGFPWWAKRPKLFSCRSKLPRFASIWCGR